MPITIDAREETLDRIATTLGELLQEVKDIHGTLQGCVPRYYVNDPNEIVQAHISQFFAETPAGAVRRVDDRVALALDKLKKL